MDAEVTNTAPESSATNGQAPINTGADHFEFETESGEKAQVPKAIVNQILRQHKTLAERAKAADAAEKRAQELEGKYKSSDLYDILKERGVSEDEMKELFGRSYARYLEDAQMDPREKALKQKEAELEAYRAREKEEMDKRERARHEAVVAREQERLTYEIQNAFAKSELPKVPLYYKMVVEEMATSIAAGRPLTAPQAVELVEAIAADLHQESFSKMDGAKLKRFLGENNIKRLREEQLEEHKQDPAVRNTRATGPKPQKNEKRVLGVNDFFKSLR